MSERKTWVIPKTKWHAKVYRAWRSVSVFKSDSNYRENLCHYWRVVFFWAPITLFTAWFFTARTPDDCYNRDDKIPPVVWFIIVGVAGFIAYDLYTTMTWWGATLAFFGIPAAFIGVCLLVAFTADYIKRRPKGRPVTPREPNAFVETLRSKKHRVCPLVEIENGEQS